MRVKARHLTTQHLHWHCHVERATRLLLRQQSHLHFTDSGTEGHDRCALGLTLDLPPPLLFTSLCTCRVLPGYGCRQQGLLSASVSAAVSPPHLQHTPDRLGCVHTPVQIFLFCAFAIYAERGLPV